MKASLVLAALGLTLAAVSAQAQTQTQTPPSPPPAPRHGDFAAHKSAQLAKLDQRVAAMSAMRACVAGAATGADLKTCHEQNRDAMTPNPAPNPAPNRAPG